MFIDLTIENQLKERGCGGLKKATILRCSSHQEVESISSVQIWAGLMTNFDQENIREVTSGDF